MKITLYYDEEDRLPTYGGCYSDWVSVLAIIPLDLVDGRWRIYQSTTDTIMFVITV